MDRQWMLLREVRSELESELEQLETWGRTVPTQAAAFHVQRQRIQHKLSSLMKRRWPFWIGRDAIEVQRKDILNLSYVVDDLGAIHRDAEDLLASIGEIEQWSQNEPRAELAQALEDRCRDWTTLLRRFGGEYWRPNDVVRERHDLEELREQVRRYREAKRWLAKAQGVLETLGPGPDTATLEARLPDLMDRLVQEAPDSDWIDRLKGLVEPLDRIRPPPEGVLTAGKHLLVEARKWLDLFPTQEVADQKQEYQRIEHDKNRLIGSGTGQPRDPETLNRLFAQAADLCSTLAEKAQEASDRESRLLLDQVHELADCTSVSPELIRQIERLDGWQFKRPEEYRNWRSLHEQAVNNLHSRMDLAKTTLKLQLESRIGELQKRLQATAAHVRSDQVDRQLESIDNRLQDWSRLTHVEQIMPALGEARALPKRLDDLTREVEQEELALEERRSALRERFGQLQDAFARTGVSPEPASPFELIPDTRAAETLQDGLNRAERQLAADEKALFEAAERQRDHLQAQALALYTAITDHRLRDLEPLPEIELGNEPETIAEGLIQAREGLEALTARADETEGRLRHKAADLEAYLQSILNGVHAEGDKAIARNHLAAIEDDAWTRIPAQAQRIRDRAGVVAAAEAFQYRLSGLELDARRRRGELIQALGDFKHRLCNRHYPELGRRLVDLIEGVPERSRDWPSVHRQLDAAQELLQRLEDACLRVDAYDTGRDLRRLEKAHRQQNTDNRLRAEIGDLLAALKRQGTREPLESEQRQRMQHLITRVGRHGAI